MRGIQCALREAFEIALVESRQVRSGRQRYGSWRDPHECANGAESKYLLRVNRNCKRHQYRQRTCRPHEKHQMHWNRFLESVVNSGAQELSWMWNGLTLTPGLFKK